MASGCKFPIAISQKILWWPREYQQTATYGQFLAFPGRDDLRVAVAICSLMLEYRLHCGFPIFLQNELNAK